MTLAELKAKASELGLTPDDVRSFGSLSKKATWEDAIASVQPVQPKPTDVAVTANQSSRSGWWHSTKKPFITGDGVETSQTLIDGELVESADIVDPSQLPTFQETDERFSDWEPWMIPGAVFQSSRFRFTILYFDRFGNCQCKASHSEPSEDGRWHSLRINFIKECGGQTGWRHWDKEQEGWVKIASPDDLLNQETSQASAIVPFRPVLTELTANWVKEKLPESSTPIRDKLLAKMTGYLNKGISLTDLEEMQKSSPDEKTAAIYLAILEESERLLIEAVA